MGNVQEGTIRLKDFSMDYMILGDGEKPLLLIRGLNITRLRGTSKMLLKRYRPYAERYRIYIIDRREPVPEKYTVEEVSEDVYNGMRALGLTRVPVMGNSQGGMIAQYLALNHPEVVEKLVLNVTTAETNETLKRNVEDWVKKTKEGKLSQVSVEFMDLMYPPGKRPEPDPELIASMGELKTHSPEEFITLAEACLTCNTKERLKEIKCPVLVMGGALDVIMSGEASVDLAHGLGTEAVLFKDLGHGAYETKEYMDKVIDFIG